MRKKHPYTNIGISSYCYPFAIGSGKKFQPEHPMSAIDLINKAIELDTVNSVATMESVSTVLENLSKYTVNLHIKDYRINRRKDAAGLVVNGTPAGNGVLNIPLILDVLKKDAPSDFNTILELWMEPEETIEETLEKEEIWVHKSISYLKSIISDQ